MPTRFREPPAPRSPLGGISSWSWLFLLGIGAALVLGQWTLLVAILGFALLIAVHELGHFLAAKAFGVRVEKFYVGFPPAAWRRRRGETEYGIGVIPLGGFCKISGMTPEEEVPPGTEGRAYHERPVWQRNLIIFAGPFMNFVAAGVILFVFLLAQGVSTASLTLDEVVPGTPGAAAGLRAGDTLVGADGRRWSTWDEASAYFRGHAGETIALTYRRAAQPAPADGGTTGATTGDVDERTVRVTLTENPNAPGQGYLGVRAGITTDRPAPWTAAWLSMVGVKDVFLGTFKGFYLLFSGRIDPSGPDGAVGPVGIIDVSRDAVQQRWYPILLAFLSVNLGLINLLPMLPFDGGHILFNTIERLRGGRRVRQVVLERAVAVGTALLILLFLLLTFNDVQRLFGG